MRILRTIAITVSVIGVIGVVAACSPTGSSSPSTSPSQPPSSQQPIAVTNLPATVDAKVGQEIVVTLPANATTGYTWAITPKTNPQPPVVTYSATPSYAAPQSPIPGQGGEAITEITAVSPGTQVLTFTYARSFAPQDKSESKELVINVTA